MSMSKTHKIHDVTYNYGQFLIQSTNSNIK
jgi:hypothetical protein